MTDLRLRHALLKIIKLQVLEITQMISNCVTTSQSS